MLLLPEWKREKTTYKFFSLPHSKATVVLPLVLFSMVTNVDPEKENNY